MQHTKQKNKKLLGYLVLAIFMGVFLTTPAATQDQPAEVITGSANDPSVANTETGPRRRFEPRPLTLTPDAPESSPAGSGSINLVPASSTSLFNCIPLANNTSFGFSGFIYRNVPPFALLPGDHIAFDLGAQNGTDVRRNIYFAVANKNPTASGCGTNVASQGIRALQWFQVVSDLQVPLNPRGNSVIGDYELTYTAEGTFEFPGGGLIVAFGGSPPGTYADRNCEQVLSSTDCTDASRFFYARFFLKPDKTLGILDVLTGGNGNGFGLGGMIIQPVVNSNQPPVARSRNVTVPAGPDCTAIASVDNGSFDPEGAAITVSQSPSGPYPLGDTTVTLTVTDDQGASGSCTATVSVVDVRPPTLTMRTTPMALWPPNHDYVTVKVAECVLSANDTCDSSVGLDEVVISKVTSDEPEDATGNGDGNTLNDIVIAANCKSVQLRAERSSNGNGRVYTITLEVQDTSGNATTTTARVAVPQNQGRNGAAQDDGVVYSVLASCP